MVSARDCNIHLAVPFSTLDETVPIPDTRPFPKELKTIGDHIKQARLERKMLIKDVLMIIGVSRSTLQDWELGNLEPFVHHYPKIIAFLGYYPFNHETNSLGGKIRKYRYMNGLSLAEFGNLLGVVHSTVGTWERNKSKPMNPKVFATVDHYLSKIQ